MANKLEISVHELATIVVSWTPEERFAGMKRFYTATYPRSVEFYSRFSKCKKKTPVKSMSTIRAKTTEADYYENLNTFENVLGLIDDDDDNAKEADAKEDLTEKSTNVQMEKRKDDIDSLFFDFMNKTSEIDTSAEASECKRLSVNLDAAKTSEEMAPMLNIGTKTEVPSQNVVTATKTIVKTSIIDENRDRYDRLLDELLAD